MTLKIGWIYNYLEEYEPIFHAATQYLINNYTAANYRYWKKIVILAICAVGSGLLLIVRVTNWVVFSYIAQYLICFLLVEQFEERNIQKFIKEYLQRPTTKRHTQDSSTDLLIESYVQPKKKVLKGQHVHSNLRNVPDDCEPIVRIPQRQDSGREDPCDQPIVRIPQRQDSTDTNNRNDQPIVRVHRPLSESTPNNSTLDHPNEDYDPSIVRKRFTSNDNLCKSVPNF